MEAKESLKELLAKYTSGELPVSERTRLWQLLDETANEQSWIEVIQELSALEPVGEDYHKEEWESVIQGILKSHENIDQPAFAPIQRNRFLHQWWAAAAVLVLLVGGLWLWRQYQRSPPMVLEQNIVQAHDALPGGDRAILTLAGGKRVVLDSAANGLLAQQGDATVEKLTNGRLVYAKNDEKTTTVVYNTLTTPRGGQYQLTLPDGTKVWLNAASSITYPTAFVGETRMVTITGEAYFEVKEEIKRPFIVKKGDAEIQVLGTHFNVNAYDDESDIKVTLLEGKVKVSEGTVGQVLLPGEQAWLKEGRVMLAAAVDTEAVMAWKNGQFLFRGVDLATIMRQVSRWYDVDVVFAQPVHEKFYAEISRNTNVSNLFKMLAITKAVHFTIEGHKVTIIP